MCNATSVESSNPGLPTQREIRDGQRGEGGKVFTNLKKCSFLSHKRKIFKLYVYNMAILFNLLHFLKIFLV